jgi:hypothetical protein
MHPQTMQHMNNWPDAWFLIEVQTQCKPKPWEISAGGWQWLPLSGNLQ